MLFNKFASMPTEDVPVTEIKKGDVIIEGKKRVYVLVLQPPILQKRPRNQSTIIDTLPPANGAPVQPDRWFLMIQPVLHSARQGLLKIGPYLAEDTVERVVQ